MNLLFEQPLVVVVLGIVLGLAAGTAWTSTGRKEWLIALAAIVVLTIAGLVIERGIVTDREAIEATLAQIARELQRNDQQAVLKHIATGATRIRQEAEAELPNYRFDECRVTKVHNVDIDDSAEPRSAIVEFNVMATGSFSHGGFEVSEQNVYRWIQLQMVREKDGQWRVQRYEHDDALRAFQSRPGQ
ncbi:MAG TPA: hypothetical protein VFV87_22765 [Pirellulaceae bacterium]|nr:hypothetical protein [Pirellulaceae bacterium]